MGYADRDSETESSPGQVWCEGAKASSYCVRGEFDHRRLFVLLVVWLSICSSGCCFAGLVVSCLRRRCVAVGRKFVVNPDVKQDVLRRSARPSGQSALSLCVMGYVAWAWSWLEVCCVVAD